MGNVYFTLESSTNLEISPTARACCEGKNLGIHFMQAQSDVLLFISKLIELPRANRVLLRALITILHSIEM